MDEPERNNKVRLLFVDDDPNVLSGLRRMLRPLRHEWDMDFAENGYVALQKMDEKPFDVLITDMRMPGMDGANLLQEVSLRFPHTVRFVLSGQSDRQTILRAAGATHQFISKPCEPDYLRKVINRSLTRRNVVTQESVRNRIAQIKTLPSPLDVCQALSRALDQTTPDMDVISRIIGDDVALTAKVFQLIQSELFGKVKNLQNVNQAVNILGAEVLDSMLETSDLFTVFDPPPECPFSLEQLQHQSRRTAGIARHVAEATGMPEPLPLRAWLAGMLHNIGQLILLACIPDEYIRLLVEKRPKNSAALCRAEKESFGTSHPDAGAYLLSLWGFSDNVVEAVEYYANPSDAPQTEHPLLAAVHLAHAVTCCECNLPIVDLDTAFLERNGLSADRERWCHPEST